MSPEINDQIHQYLGQVIHVFNESFELFTETKTQILNNCWIFILIDFSAIILRKNIWFRLVFGSDFLINWLEKIEFWFWFPLLPMILCQKSFWVQKLFLQFIANKPIDALIYSLKHKLIDSFERNNRKPIDF